MNSTTTKIILVEDEQLLREICSKKLQKMGFEVKTAIDGAEALREIKNWKPDLVLLDIMLPTMDGFEILKQLRADADPISAKVPVIMLSNLGQDSDVKRAMQSGANAYMIKAEFTTDEITMKVKEVLDKAKK